MAFAIDSISRAYHRTKNLFFPIRLNYWLKMGFVGLLRGPKLGSTGFSGNSNYTSGEDFPAEFNIREVVAQANSQALNFLSKYGFLVSFSLFLLYLLCLLLTYINSVFTFMFIEGIVNKDIKIRKSFTNCKKQGASLFSFRLVFGLISMALILLIFYPLIRSFFDNNLADFNVMWFIPIFVAILVYSFFASIILFVVYDFLVPIMYMKKYSFLSAWHYFLKITKNKMLEVFIYWLVRMGIILVSTVISIIIFIPLVLVLLLFVGLGVGTYFIVLALLGEIIAIIMTTFTGILLLLLLLYMASVLYAPIASFFTAYSLEMLAALEKSNKKISN